jgi:hypothetical protein
VIAKGRKKHTDPLRKPAPAIVPTELPVFSELERLGLVVPMSARAGAKKPASPRGSRRR